ncbi:hypothetical protein BBK82_03610 [Lentzea guizhouensis]|uniref:Uncharacterized protein n=1 Tax=Lentzea guizhouensis TaxID=1586287 RepID=A0A1B2HC65_9PSEU|nr:hypothetical protein [Lentzea guizhouensis]ANZ35303.1 hypothetical protein BBK82_03610 [Lentzea guizhouensis]
MADIQIPREAVEAAARAIQFLDSGDVDKWDDLLVTEKRFFLRSAEHALYAAAPFIKAAYAERKGKELNATADAFLRSGKRTKGSWFGHIAGQLLAEASTLRNGRPRS